MNKCKKTRKMFDDVFFNEISESDKNAFDRHLESCSKCRTEFQKNNLMLANILPGQSVEPSPDFWENYTANLHQRMLSEGVLTEGKSRTLAGWFTAFSVPRWALQAAAALSLVIIGIFIGRMFFPGTIPAPQNGQESNNFASLLQRTGDFIDRSRVILLAIENVDLETQSVQAINLPYQRKISKDLVKSATALKRELSQSRQRRLEELIDELEVILLQIANMDPGSEMETLRLVKGGQYVRGMLYKIRINDLRRSSYKTKKKKRRI